MYKKGVSSVVTTVLIILLVLAAVAMIGGILLKNIQETADKIESGFNTARLSVVPQSVHYGPDEQYNNRIDLNIQREPGEGNMAGLNILFKYKSGKGVVVRKDIEIKELETKPFSEELGRLNIDSSDIIKQISVVPILKTSKGKEFFGELLAEYRYEGVDYRRSEINYMTEQEYTGERDINTGQNAYGFEPVGQNGENSILKSAGPYGNEIVVWRGKSAANDEEESEDGGLKAKVNIFYIDKIHRFSVWAKKTGGYIDDGKDVGTYFDLDGSNIFCNGKLLLNKWYLFVGYLYPSNMQLPSVVNTGIYDPETGLKISGFVCNDINMISGQVTYSYRAYLYSDMNPSGEQYFYAPRVDIVDGTEPSIYDLLNPYK
ncbi:MAG: hypothetical protein AABW75_00440 [Nanoarchaeota archaeon]